MSPKARAELVKEVRRWVPVVSTPEEAASRIWGKAWSVPVPRFLTDSVELHGTRAIARWDALDFHGEPDEDDYVVLVRPRREPRPGLRPLSPTRQRRRTVTERL